MSLVLLPFLALFFIALLLLVPVLTAGTTLVFAQKDDAAGGAGDKRTTTTWTAEIMHTSSYYPYMLRTSEAGDEESGFKTFTFTGTFSFTVDKEAQFGVRGISGKGTGYVVTNLEAKLPHHELKPLCSVDREGKETCYRNYVPEMSSQSHGEGQVTFVVGGTFRTDSPSSGWLALDFTTQSVIETTGEYRKEEGAGVLVGEAIPVIQHNWDVQNTAFCLSPTQHQYCTYDAPYGEPYPYTEPMMFMWGFDVEGGKLYEGLVLDDSDEREDPIIKSQTEIRLLGPDCETKPEPPNFKSHDNGLWRVNYGVVDREGLVLQDVNIGSAHVLDALSMPHSKVRFSDGKEEIIRYCSATDKHIGEPQVNGDSIRWSFSRQFGQDTPETPRDNGILTISYNFIARSTAVNNCELGKSDCLRLIPTVTYKWNGDPSYFKQFTAFYKLDYGEQTGLTLVKDGNRIPSPVGVQQFQTKEISFRAVDNGAPGRFDNIHTGHPGDHVSVPGCRPSAYDCLHIHWRWGDIDPAFTDPLFPIDPLVNPFTGTTLEGRERGKPYLVPGQTIDVAIVKHNPGEEDPDDPLSLAKEGESLAENGLGSRDGCRNNDVACLKSASHPIVWYVSSVDDTISTTFFVHGLFVLDTTK
jgi:hypothetical protein